MVGARRDNSKKRIIERGNKHVEAFMSAHLQRGEAVVVAIGADVGAVIATTERIVYYQKGSLVFPEQLESIWYDKISGIEGAKPLTGRGFTLTISTSGKERKFRCVAGGFGFDDGGKSRMSEYVAVINEARRSWATRGKQSEASPARNATERLRELNDLHKAGLITDEEFQERRRSIIAGI